jgi:hypothetical protein
MWGAKGHVSMKSRRRRSCSLSGTFASRKYSVLTITKKRGIQDRLEWSELPRGDELR